MDKPTEAQIKEFWEKCGLHYEYHELFFGTVLNSKRTGWYCKDKYIGKMPPVDLNNLFRWAVLEATTKLIMTGIGIRNSWDKLLKIWMDFYFEGMGLEDALFWAIWEVRHDR